MLLRRRRRLGLALLEAHAVGEDILRAERELVMAGVAARAVVARLVVHEPGLLVVRQQLEGELLRVEREPLQLENLLEDTRERPPQAHDRADCLLRVVCVLIDDIPHFLIRRELDQVPEREAWCKVELVTVSELQRACTLQRERLLVLRVPLELFFAQTSHLRLHPRRLHEDAGLEALRHEVDVDDTLHVYSHPDLSLAHPLCSLSLSLRP